MCSLPANHAESRSVRQCSSLTHWLNSYSLQVVLNHIVPGELTSTAIKAVLGEDGGSTIVLSLLGSYLYVTTVDDGLYVQSRGLAAPGALIVAADVITCVGPVHLIDNVLLPAEPQAMAAIFFDETAVGPQADVGAKVCSFLHVQHASYLFLCHRIPADVPMVTTQMICVGCCTLLLEYARGAGADCPPRSRSELFFAIAVIQLSTFAGMLYCWGHSNKCWIDCSN